MAEGNGRTKSECRSGFIFFPVPPVSTNVLLQRDPGSSDGFVAHLLCDSNALVLAGNKWPCILALVHGEQSSIHYVLAAGYVIKVGRRGSRLRFETRVVEVAVKALSTPHPFSPPISLPSPAFNCGVYLHVSTSPLHLVFLPRLLPPPALLLLLLISFPLPPQSSSLVSLPRQTRDIERSPQTH